MDATVTRGAWHNAGMGDLNLFADQLRPPAALPPTHSAIRDVCKQA